MREQVRTGVGGHLRGEGGNKRDKGGHKRVKGSHRRVEDSRKRMRRDRLTLFLHIYELKLKLFSLLFFVIFDTFWVV